MTTLRKKSTTKRGTIIISSAIFSMGATRIAPWMMSEQGDFVHRLNATAPAHTHTHTIHMEYMTQLHSYIFTCHMYLLTSHTLSIYEERKVSVPLRRFHTQEEIRTVSHNVIDGANVTINTIWNKNIPHT